MAAQVANHAIAVFLSMFLDGMTYVADISLGLSGLQAYLQTFLGDPHLVLFLRSGLTYYKHTRGIGKVAVYDGRHVYVDDVALLQHIPHLRYAVAYHFVD